MLKQPGTTVQQVPPAESNASSKTAESLPPSINPGKQSQTLCRNILIHGYCKYENSGCIFRHDTPTTKAPSSPVKNDARRRLNVESPSFQPGTTGRSARPAGTMPTFTPQVLDAPTFVPRGGTSSTVPQQPPSQQTADASVMSGFEGFMQVPPVPTNVVESFPQQQVMGAPFVTPGYGAPHQTTSPIAIDPSPLPTPSFEFASVNPYQPSSQDMYFQGAHATHYQPLQYHLYAPLPPHPTRLQPYQKTANMFFVSDNLREELQRKAEASLQVLPGSSLPELVGEYYSLVPLDKSLDKNNRVFGYTTSLYKAFSEKDGATFALRRLEGFKLNDEKAILIADQWKRVTSANVVVLHEAFTSHQFGDTSVIFVYDYHPLSSTLYDTHFGPNARYLPVRSNAPIVPEQVLWSYLSQLASALRSIHAANLAARVLDPTKIILTSKMRVRISCVGVADVIDGSNDFKARAEALPSHQAYDLYNLGRLILSIASNMSSISIGVPQPQVIDRAMEIVSRQYSVDLKNALIDLLTPKPTEGGTTNIDTFISRIATYMQRSLDASLHQADQLEGELMGELENGRLVRLLCKLGFINERPEYEHDSSWSETGDRYLLKLFRDYVFHAVDDQGNPVVDLGHVLRCLNKLDSGVDEKIMLVSRDEQSTLIVTYKELKNCVDTVFRDLNKVSK